MGLGGNPPSGKRIGLVMMFWSNLSSQIMRSASLLRCIAQNTRISAPPRIGVSDIEKISELLRDVSAWRTWVRMMKSFLSGGVRILVKHCS
jgi:hypothetical protein